MADMIVLRATYDALERSHAATLEARDAQAQDLRRQLAMSEEGFRKEYFARLNAEQRRETVQLQYDALRADYAGLVQTLAASIPAPKPSTMPEKKGNRITEVIADIAGTNGPLRKQLGKYAREAARNSVDEDTIVHSLMHWPSADEGDE